jgi:predicted phosphodiesterase
MEDTTLDDLLADFEDLISNIETTKEIYSDYTPQHIYTKDMDVWNDIMIIFSSDIHLGSIYTDYKKLIEIWTTIIQNDRMYLAVVGDFIDNFDLNSVKLLQAGVNSQLLTPLIQRDIFTKYIQALAAKGKLLACVLGNHEMFSHQYPYFQMLQNLPVSANRMFLKLKVGINEYKIALIHKSRYNSYMNPIHSCYRELTLFYPDADIVVTAHTHLPAMAVIPYPSDGYYKNRVLIKTGTLKTLDPYTLANFSHELDTSVSLPCVILSYLHHSITPFNRIDDARKFLRRT